MPTSERGLGRTRRRATRSQKWKRRCWWWWWWLWWRGCRRKVCARKLRDTITCGKRVFHGDCDGVRGRIRICGSVCGGRHDIPYVRWRWWFCTNRRRDPVRSSTNSGIRHTITL
ncbi:hypothetical protein EDD16DRAFT_1676316 [Pisolithus croceorrhizus]|nr:hypothetical protein EDD16DRAFT_1676316 [Pisolithus croceorrhizus]